MMISQKIVFVVLVLACVHTVWAQSIEDILAEDVPAAAQVPLKSASTFGGQIEKLVGSKNPNYNVVYRLVDAKDWSKAAIQYPKVFAGSSFYTSTNGIALQAILQYHTGLKVTALETLFRINQPKQIDLVLQKYLTTLVSKDDPAWMMAQIKWSNAWQPLFGQSPQVWTEFYALDGMSMDQLQQLAKQQAPDSKEQSLVNWHIAVKYAIANESEKSAKLLSQIRRNPNSFISPDLVQLTASRILFQNAYYETAIKQYEKIPKTSEYWPQAQEEMAWSFIRKGESHNAIAVGQTLIHPGLAQQVTPESFFIMSLAQLKVCDYPSVINTLSQFPKRFKQRNTEMKDLIASTENKNLEAYFQMASNAKNRGEILSHLPANITQDKKLAGLMQKQTVLQNEADVASTLDAQSLALTGLQGHFETLKKNTLVRAQAAKSEAVARVKFLAKNEVENIKTNLDKLHIVEAEVLQQVSIADQIAQKAKDDGKTKIGSTGSKSKDAMVFPAESEVWFDEISTYKVDVKKACAAAPKNNKAETL